MLPLVLSVVAVTFICWVYARRTLSKLLPPGPPRELLLGNARQLKVSHSWLYFSDLAEKYGLLGQDLRTARRRMATDAFLRRRRCVCGCIGSSDSYTQFLQSHRRSPGEEVGNLQWASSSVYGWRFVSCSNSTIIIR